MIDFSVYGYKKRAVYVKNVLSLNQYDLDMKAIEGMVIKKGDRGCGIYGIFNVKTKGLYVGSTTDFHKRIRHHLLDIKKGESYASINKDIEITGIDSFNFIKIHDIPDKSQLIEAENFWMSELSATYNKGKARVMNITIEDRRKARINGFKEMRHYSVSVIKCNMNGDEISEYGSIRAAAVDMGGKYLAFRISKVCRGKMDSAYGFVWKYKDGMTPNKPKWGKKNIDKKVVQIDMGSGDFIKIWDSIKDAAIFYGLKADSIRRVCMNNKEAGGFIWKFANTNKFKL